MIELDISKALQAADGKMNLKLQLVIKEGQLVCLYGPSGVGKTSTLRMLAGLMKPDAGEIIVNGKVWFSADKKINLSPQKRNIGFVFQDYALFPNMSVRQNLEFALKRGADKKRITELIIIMDLKALEDRKPEKLSGGQQQRVAVARALVQQPQVLLLDEPLAALDIRTRLKLQDYIAKLQQEYGVTTVLISHDIGEILKLSDRVFVLESGEIIRQGRPDEVFINTRISGKFKFTGEVLKIEQQEVIFVISVLVQSELVKVIVQATEGRSLEVGDKVVVASKAFNPVLYKI
ncbi:MAG: ABC transporter ATP-binding protein [Flavobacteriaceae bacterium]